MTNKTDDHIVDLYCNKNKSTYQIAKEMNTYPNKIRRVLIKNGVQIKTKSEAQKNALNTGVKDHPTKGKPRTDKEKIKIGKSVSSSWKNLSDKEKQLRVEKSKERWKNMPEKQKEKMRALAS